MRLTPSKTLTLAALGALVTVLGCRPKQATNQDLLDEFGGEKYSEDMVATDYETVEDQGDAIDPRTQASIDDAIRTVWVTDFESCLEKEMSRLENRWIGGAFTIEFVIEPTGMVSSAKILEVDVQERRTKNAEGKFVSEGGEAPRKADQFADCVTNKALLWEFDPAPEVTYTHSYRGEVGEAW